MISFTIHKQKLLSLFHYSTTKRTLNFAHISQLIKQLALHPPFVIYLRPMLRPETKVAQFDTKAVESGMICDQMDEIDISLMPCCVFM